MTLGSQPSLYSQPNMPVPPGEVGEVMLTNTSTTNVSPISRHAMFFGSTQIACAGVGSSGTPSHSIALATVAKLMRSNIMNRPLANSFLNRIFRFLSFSTVLNGRPVNKFSVEFFSRINLYVLQNSIFFY